MRKIDFLQQKIWQRKSYYQTAKEGSLAVNYPGMKILQQMAVNTESILDLGCGEGTRLNSLSIKKKSLGIDISQTAINIAKQSFSHLKFKVANLEKLPLKDESFSLVYSAFVLEHLNNPEKMLAEAIRVTSLGGYLVLMAPNFGAPNRASPSFKGSRLKKFISGILADLRRLVIFDSQLRWEKVEPLVTEEKYDIDWDTTIEPYIGTLIPYLKSKRLRIEKVDSCWGQELRGAKFYQKIFKVLGELCLYPFLLWGPHLLVVARKDLKNEK